MATRIKCLLFSILLGALFSTAAQAKSVTAASCNTSDVQNAINSAAAGDTVLVPAGNCTWTSGVTISGKGIKIQGAGSGRIIAQSPTNITVGTGAKTFTLTSARVDGTYPLGPTVGQTLLIQQTGKITNFMQGTVTSFSGGTLVMNITSMGGSGAQEPWIISTIPSTVIIDSSSSTLFGITEDINFHTDISGIKFVQGGGTGRIFGIGYAAGGQAVLLHDFWIEQGPNTAADAWVSNTNRGVIWNCSLDSSPFRTQFGFGTIKQSSLTGISDPKTGSWVTPSTWGASDTTGQSNYYVENCDFHAYLGIFGNDDSGRIVFRHNVLDNAAAFETHGADSSPIGGRYFEAYNNVGYLDTNQCCILANGSIPMTNGWFYIRGGSFVIHDNTLPAIDFGSAYGLKSDINMYNFNLNSNGGNGNAYDFCWGAGTSGGALHHSPRQVGFGFVTGTGKDGKGNGSDGITYVGDSEPGYSWNNSRTLTMSVGTYNGPQCTSNPDSVANYIVSGRDYFNGTAKPGYTPYTYPHPLAQGSTSTGNSVASPTNLTVVAIQ